MFRIFLLWLLARRSGDRLNSMTLEYGTDYLIARALMYTGPSKEQE
jgi:hypothetical protein